MVASVEARLDGGAADAGALAAAAGGAGEGPRADSAYACKVIIPSPLPPPPATSNSSPSPPGAGRFCHKKKLPAEPDWVLSPPPRPIARGSVAAWSAVGRGVPSHIAVLREAVCPDLLHAAEPAA